MKPFWYKIPVVIRSIFSGLLVVFSGIIPWAILFEANLKTSPSIPWSVIVCIIYLYYWNRFLMGKTVGVYQQSRIDRYRRLTSESKNKIKVFVIGCLISLTSLLLMIWVYWYFQIPIEKMSVQNINFITLIIYFAMASFVAGLCEEVGFRGYMQQPIEVKHDGLVAIAVSTLLFALLHLGNDDAIYLMPFYIFNGAFLGVLAWRTQSLRLSIVFHIGINFTSYLVLLSWYN